MTNRKTTRNEHGTFLMSRHERSFELVCDRCLQAKVTKIDVIWTTPQGRTKRLCNGCYGRLLSGEPL